jgi:hypothetical protein
MAIVQTLPPILFPQVAYMLGTRGLHRLTDPESTGFSGRQA